MREILFRGKRLNDGEWVEGYYAKCQEPINHGIGYILPKVKSLEFGNIICIGGFIEVKPETVGQYTGLTDINGKKIFDGDICRNTTTGEIVYVKWSGVFAGYIWQNQKKGNSKLYLRDFGELFKVYDKIEVIGNIHDNPELLK